MSHHSQGLLHPRRPWPLHQPNRAQYPLLYLVATPIPHLQRLLLEVIAHCVMASRPCTPSQVRLGELLGRRRETICRALHAMQVQRLIRVRRRGRRLSNVYLLARRIWQAIAGKEPPYWKDRQLHLRYEAGRQGGLTPWRAAAVALGYG